MNDNAEQKFKLEDCFHETTKSRDKDAGAGGSSALLAIIIGGVACVVYLCHQYFIAMAIMAIAMVLYNEGKDIILLGRDYLTTLLRTEHISDEAREITEVGLELRDQAKEHILCAKEINFTQDKRLSFILKHFYGKKSDLKIEPDEIEEIIQTHYFSDTHDQYSQHITTLEFTSNVMPLWGIVGTLFVLVGIFQNTDFAALDITRMMNEVGLAMKSTLYGALFAVVFKLFAGRFKKRRTALEYDFEELMGHYMVLYKSKK